MKIKENVTDFITGPYPKTHRRSPEKLTLGRKKPCSRVELLRAWQTLPLPPLAPPSSSGANGRSHLARRGRKCQTRSPEFSCLRLLFGSVARVHGGLRRCPERNHRSSLVRMGVSPSSAWPEIRVAGGQPV